MAGLEKFKTLNNIYYRNADCFLLVYDITNKKSFEDSINFYIDKIRENCKKNYEILLIGNKIDLVGKSKIIPEKASIFSFENNCLFMETSCISNYNVYDAFQNLIESFLLKRNIKEQEAEEDNDDEAKKLSQKENPFEKLINFPKSMEFLNY